MKMSVGDFITGIFGKCYSYICPACEVGVLSENTQLEDLRLFSPVQ